MVRSSIKTVTYSSGSRKVNRSRQLVAKATQLLRARMAGTPRAPLRTGGFYGVYTRRGRDELKTVDVATASANLTLNAAFVLLNGVTQGTDYTERIGRKTIMKSIFLRFSLVPNVANSAPTGDFARIIIFYDCQTNGAAPIAGDVLKSGTDYLSPLNLNNRDRFKILMDKLVSMNPNVYTAGAVTAGDPVNKTWKLYKKITMDTVFAGTNNTVASISTGSIYLMYMSAGATSYSTLSYNSRIRFIDS